MGIEERRQSLEIGSVIYEAVPLPFGQGRKALVKTVKILSPVISSIYKEQGNEKKISGLFDALPMALNDEDVVYFANLFGGASWFVDKESGNKVPLVSANQELHFAGRYYEFCRWIAFCMEVNFSDFFTGISSVATSGDLRAVMAKV